MKRYHSICTLDEIGFMKTPDNQRQQIYQYIKYGHENYDIEIKKNRTID